VIACLAGQEGSRRYQVEDGVLEETGIGQIRAGEVHGLPAEAIHAVFNCWAEENLVLHLYGGDFLSAAKRVWDPITGTCSALGLAEPLTPVKQVR
jgi:predicted metal-dependent enzyme (double-stranded beta helix superfamily)